MDVSLLARVSVVVRRNYAPPLSATLFFFSSSTREVLHNNSNSAKGCDLQTTLRRLRHSTKLLRIFVYLFYYTVASSTCFHSINLGIISNTSKMIFMKQCLLKSVSTGEVLKKTVALKSIFGKSNIDMDRFLISTAQLSTMATTNSGYVNTQSLNFTLPIYCPFTYIFRR